MRKIESRYKHITDWDHILTGKCYRIWDFPGGSMVKNMPAMQGRWFRLLGQEDSLEKEMATHYSIFAWEIPWTEEPAGYCSWGRKSQT